MKFYESWKFLKEHKIFNVKNCPWRFQDSLDIQVVNVNSDNKSNKNTEKSNVITQVWIETGPFIFNKNENKYYMSHDIRLDSSGENFEESIIKLAMNVKKYYVE